MIVRHDQHVRARGEVGERGLGHGSVAHRHGRDRIGEQAARPRNTHSIGMQHLGSRIDQVQLELLAREDAGELETHMPQTEDRDRRDDADRFEQHRDFSSAALHTVVGHGLVAQGEREQPWFVFALSEHLARQVDRGRLEVSAPHRTEQPSRRDDELRPAVARRMPSHGREGHEHSGRTRLAQPPELVDPVHCRPLYRAPVASSATPVASRAAWIAQNTASGVEGDASTTE